MSLSFLFGDPLLQSVSHCGRDRLASRVLVAFSEIALDRPLHRVQGALSRCFCGLVDDERGCLEALVAYGEGLAQSVIGLACCSSGLLRRDELDLVHAHIAKPLLRGATTPSLVLCLLLLEEASLRILQGGLGGEKHRLAGPAAIHFIVLELFLNLQINLLVMIQTYAILNVN